jgi:hypothetical protein
MKSFKILRINHRLMLNRILRVFTKSKKNLPKEKPFGPKKKRPMENQVNLNKDSLIKWLKKSRLLNRIKK